MSGEGAAGGAVNFVTKTPQAGPIQNEAFVSYDSFGTLRTAIGSGGSTAVQGLDYRVDLSRSGIKGLHRRYQYGSMDCFRPAQLSRVRNFQAFVAEYKRDSGSALLGHTARSDCFSGPFALPGLVSGSYRSFYNGTNLGPVTIDSRTLTTNYNVLDNKSGATTLWLRGGFEWLLSDGVTLRTQAYAYNADREWFNNEISAFNSAVNLVDRERFFVGHNQKLYGDMTDLTWNSRIAGMDNRAAVGIGASRLEFARPGAANFPFDQVTLVSPNRGFYGLLTTQLRRPPISITSI
jgi:iron complex outermembrane receptor protein